jgi:hypothetical protein
MMFCEVVGAVVGSGPPVIFELLLRLAVMKPMKTHVHGLCEARLNVVGDDSKSCAVIGFDWGFQLLVAHFFEELASAPSSASEALDMTALSILGAVCTVPLSLGSSELSEQKK